MWVCPWGEISHCIYMGSGVALILYNSSTREPFIIPCKNETSSQALYTIFYNNAFRMGNPSNVMSLDTLLNTNRKVVVDTQTGAGAALPSVALVGGELDGYRFGDANEKIAASALPTELRIINQAEKAVLGATTLQVHCACVLALGNDLH